MLWLDEDESFSLQANVISAGPQTTVLRGMMVKQVGGQTYTHPLLPQFFYGASGSQLSSWRQNLTQTGSQTILSRSGGLPEPAGQLYWQKVKRQPTEVSNLKADVSKLQVSLPIILLGIAALGIVAYVLTR